MTLAMELLLLQDSGWVLTIPQELTTLSNAFMLYTDICAGKTHALTKLINISHKSPLCGPVFL